MSKNKFLFRVVCLLVFSRESKKNWANKRRWKRKSNEQKWLTPEESITRNRKVIITCEKEAKKNNEPFDKKKNSHVPLIIVVLWINQCAKEIDNDQVMSTQSYYKDRLGFDPREAIYDGPVKGSRGHSQTSHYSVSNGNNNDHYATPPKKHKHQQQQHHASYQQQHDQSPQGGYEDALTQFKGSMSLWEYFVENSDKLGMSVVCWVRKIQTTDAWSHCVCLPVFETCLRPERSWLDSPETLHRSWDVLFVLKQFFVCFEFVLCSLKNWVNKTK